MRASIRYLHKLRGVAAGAATAALIAVLATASSTLAADPGSSGTNTGGPGTAGPVTLSAADAALAAQKDRLAQDYALVRAGKLDRTTFEQENQAFLVQHGGMSAEEAAAGSAALSPLATSNTLQMSEYAQGTTYFCGPASAYELLRFKNGGPGPQGEALSQTALGQYVPAYPTSYLQTNQYQRTDWDRGVMAPTLNTWGHFLWYVAHNGAGSFQTHLVYDIDNSWPVVIGVFEAQGGIHLVGHPVDQEIRHWVTARGYAGSGATTNYADSVALTNFWTWSSQVPRYSNFSSSDMSSLMSPFGYVY